MKTLENGDTEHRLDEFGSLPWEKIDVEGLKNKTCPLRHYVFEGERISRPIILFVSPDDLKMDCWEIPPQLWELIDSMIKSGRNFLRHDIKKLLEREE